MVIQCIFYLPTSPKLCQVLAACAAPALDGAQRRGLERKHCTSGGFMLCPIFERVERGLAAYHAPEQRVTT